MFLNAHSKKSPLKHVEISCCKASDNESIKSLGLSRLGKKLIIGTSAGDVLLFSTENLSSMRQDVSCTKLPVHVLHRLDDHDGTISCCSFPKVDPHSLLVPGMAVSEYGGTIWMYWLGNQFAYHAMIMQYINKD